MSQYKKMLDRICSRPYKRDVEYKEIETVLKRNGFHIEYGKGDHVVFRHDKIKGHISIDSGGGYIKIYSLNDITNALEELGVLD